MSGDFFELGLNEQGETVMFHHRQGKPNSETPLTSELMAMFDELQSRHFKEHQDLCKKIESGELS